MTVRVLDPVGVELDALHIGGVDEVDVDEMQHLLADYGVVVLRDQDIDDEQFLRFLGRFGNPVFTVGETAVDGFADLNVVTNVGRTTPPRSVFHVDTSYVRRPPAYTALRTVAVPEQGGQTVFTNQYRAHDTLSPELREHLRGRLIRHALDPAAGIDPGGQETTADHPVFRVHPISGRTSLYLSTPARCVAISGLGEDESRRLIEQLYAHSTRDDNLLRHRWRPGDVVMWDNGVVLHKADHSGVVGDRVMHRGMVDGYAAEPQVEVGRR